MPPGQSYPSPNAAQIAGSAGPFFGQNGDSSQIAPELQTPSQADISRSTAPMMTGPPGSVADLNRRKNRMQFHDVKLASSHLDEDSSEADEHQRLAQDVMSLNNQAGFNDNTPTPRKRSKVSRACDECRRKKIRCDATAESPSDPCSSCQRTGAPCQFSRQPMKRGPSKGYIKELADRLNALEGQLGPNAHSLSHPDHNQYMHGLSDEGMVSRLGDMNDFSPPQGSGLARKRTHSISEGYSGFPRESPYAQTRPEASWSADPTRQGPPHTPRTAAAEVATPFSPNGVRYTGGSDNVARQESVTAPFDESLTSAAVDWDEDVIDGYYRILHPTFPLLPQAKSRLQVRLAGCSNTLREAFLFALDCYVRSSPLSRLAGGAVVQQNARKASELLAMCQQDNAATRPMSSNIVYLQALVLMALESEHSGSQTDDQSGPSTSEWLGRAIGFACHLKLDVAPARDTYNDGSDADSDAKLGRRIWAIIFTLAHWHAASISTNSLVPQGTERFIPDEAISFGDVTFHLARLSRVAGHLTKLVKGSSWTSLSPSLLLETASESIIGELTLFRESVEQLLLDNANIVYISYWHMRLLALRHVASTPAAALLVPAAHIATLMSNPQTLSSPLCYHWAVLGALTLVEIADDESVRQSADKALDDLIGALNLRRETVTMGKEDASGWDNAVRELVMRKRTQLASAASEKPESTSASGLQHLADAAIGGAKRKNDGSGTGTMTAGGMGVTEDVHEPAKGPFERSALIEKGYFGELVAALSQPPAPRT